LANRLLPLSGATAIVGGLLMFLGGVTSHSITLWILPTLKQEILTHTPATVHAEALLAIGIIAALVSLGGITVIFGGLLLLAKRRSTGRLLIAMGGGAGLIGLCLALGYYLYVNGPAGVSAHAGYWIGLVLAVVARRVAGKSG
jgi:hypothetical protein